MREATDLRSQAKPLSRISGKPHADSNPEIPLEVKGKTDEAGGSQVISEKSGGSEVGQALSTISKEISTSMNSIKLELGNGLGPLEARFKNV